MLFRVDGGTSFVAIGGGQLPVQNTAMKVIFSLLLLLGAFDFALAQPWISVELGPAWQTRNDVRIPSDGGSPFSLSRGNAGPFFAGRVYAGLEWSERHELRLLIAPLSVKSESSFEANTNFAGETFAAGAVMGTYTFNSYRLTYRYQFYQDEVWGLKAGFTAKIRDAQIALTQGSKSASSSNVGFVPLLNFSARYQWLDNSYLLFDVDGLAAPQGRAVDATLQAIWQISPNYEASFGYRTVEGGAENSTVSTFAWIHYVVLGASARF